ncbi:type II secretion system protein [Aquabacterium sp.]|uniref:type II secretion system protein n=1 Tax=Aquabacterium sp. TaxID=1872578 RepID=UPI003D6C8E02
MRPHRQRGFTLIEMVVVVLMVGILASAAMPLAALHKRRAQEADLRQALRTLRTAIDAYKRAWDLGHIEKKADESGYPPNLEALVKGVPDVTSPNGERIYFLRRLPRDPMADDPAVPAASTWGLRSYDSPPDAPAPGKDVFDVRSLREGVAIDGTLYQDW